jgi:hypothetical protein
MEKILDIENREGDLINIEKQEWRAELGLRAVAVIYDDHSHDKNSKENVFRLKENINYRLFSNPIFRLVTREPMAPCCPLTSLWFP